MKDDYEKYAPTVLRVFMGLLFLVPGLQKAGNAAGVSEMLGLSMFLVWILILVEVLGGAALILGWQIRWTIAPLFVILVVALFTMHLGQFALGGSDTVRALFQLVGIAALINLYLTGPGEYALSKH